MSRLQFQLKTRDGRARRGRLTFPRGTVETPAFMPVGTYGSVKGILPDQVRALGAEIILGNTFHLYLRPGLDIIADHGGLHGFCRWDGPILTDSGGFQVFSLAHRRKITEQGVTFASPTDGARVFLGPEESMKIQKVLDSDVVMIFDECTPYPATEDVARRSMELSLRWAQRRLSSIERRATSSVAGYGVHSSKIITTSESSTFWIFMLSSGPRNTRAPSVGEAKVTPCSVILRRWASENTWKPPESVRIGPSQRQKPCRPPWSAMMSRPGRRYRWKVLPRMISAPSARTWSGRMPLTEP